MSSEKIYLSASVGSICYQIIDVIFPPPVLLIDALRYTVLSLGIRLIKPKLRIFTFKYFGWDF